MRFELSPHFFAGFAWGAGVYFALRFLRTRSEEAERVLGCLPVSVPFLVGLAFSIFGYPLLLTVFALTVLVVSGAGALLGCWFEQKGEPQNCPLETAFFRLFFAGNAALVFGALLHLWIPRDASLDERFLFLRGCVLAPCTLAFLRFVARRASRGSHRF